MDFSCYHLVGYTIWLKFQLPQYINRVWLHEIENSLPALSCTNKSLYKWPMSVMINDWSCRFSQSLLVTSHGTSVTHTPGAKHVVVLLFDFSNKPTRHFTALDSRKRKLVNRDESLVEKHKVIILTVKFTWKVSCSCRTSWLWENGCCQRLRDPGCAVRTT